MDDIKSLVTRLYDTWNEHDRDGWLACFNDDVEFKGPGGLAGQGPDMGRMFCPSGRTHSRTAGPR